MRDGWKWDTISGASGTLPPCTAPLPPACERCEVVCRHEVTFAPGMREVWFFCTEQGGTSYFVTLTGM